LTIDFHLENIK